MKHLLTYCLLVLPFFGWNQLTLTVDVNAAGQGVNLNIPIVVSDQQVQLEQVRFYLSKFAFYKGDQLITTDPVEAYLIDLENDSTRTLLFPTIDPKHVDRVSFLFGIDSITNTSGVMGGALDPMYGMYWSWQSGYINCKIEGTVGTSKPKPFQYHLGGYSGEFLAAQSISLTTTPNESFRLNIDLTPLLNTAVRSGEETHVMSPCTKAVEYTRLLAETIVLKP